MKPRRTFLSASYTELTFQVEAHEFLVAVQWALSVVHVIHWIIIWVLEMAVGRRHHSVVWHVHVSVGLTHSRVKLVVLGTHLRVYLRVHWIGHSWIKLVVLGTYLRVHLIAWMGHSWIKLVVLRAHLRVHLHIRLRHSRIHLHILVGHLRVKLVVLLGHLRIELVVLHWTRRRRKRLRIMI